MKYAILSDVHANPVALEKALRDIEEQKVDKTICLGDVVGYGPDAPRAIRLVRERVNDCLMGNHDAAVSEIITCNDFSLPALRGVQRHRKETSDEDRQWLSELPYVYADDAIACAHGEFSKPEAFRYVTKPSRTLPSFAMRSEQILFVGHTHRPTVFRLTGTEPVQEEGIENVIKIEEGSRYLVNVGSVGYPRYQPDSTYCVYDTDAKTLSFRKLPFDFEWYVKEMTQKGERLPLWFLDIMDEERSRRRKKFFKSLWQKIKNFVR